MQAVTLPVGEWSASLPNVDSAGKLSNIELGLVRELLRKSHFHEKGAIWTPGSSELIIEGWVLHCRNLSDARRQVLDILLPGDIIEIVDSEHSRADEFVAVTPVRTVVLTADSGDPGLTGAFEELRSRRRQRLFEQLFRLGTLDAYERTVHLLIAMYERSGIEVSLEANSVPFPLTHTMLADALGLSVVHVDRILARLRTEKILTIQSGHLVVLDPDAILAIEAGWTRSQ